MAIKKAASSTTTPERDEKGHFVFSQDDAQNQSSIKKLPNDYHGDKRGNNIKRLPN
jgi:hypothetical protein